MSQRFPRTDTRQFSIGDLVVCYQPLEGCERRVDRIPLEGGWFCGEVVDPETPYAPSRTGGRWIRVQNGSRHNCYDGGHFPIYPADQVPAEVLAIVSEASWFPVTRESLINDRHESIRTLEEEFFQRTAQKTGSY